MRFEYFINLDERGEFYADVRTPDGETVLDIHGFDIFEDGDMRHTEDYDGLLDYLVYLGIAEPGDSVGKGSLC